MSSVEVGIQPMMYSRDEKIAMVHAWQRHYNMQPRSDSRLTQMFADGTTPLQADEVARELMATDFIYKHTLYGQLIEEFMRHVADYVHKTYKLSWTATWNIVRFYGPIAIKLICLLNSGQQIPARMPDEHPPPSPTMTCTTEGTAITEETMSNESNTWPDLIAPPHSDHSDS